MSIDGCRAKLRRAELRQQELEHEVALFRERHPWRITVYRELARSAYRFHAREVTQPGSDLGNLIGECAHSARSALDQLAYQLVVLGLKRSNLTEQEKRRVGFPIARDADEFKGRARFLKDLRERDGARLEVLQPYHAWDRSIWGPPRDPGPPAPLPSYLGVLAELDDADRRGTLLPVWFVVGNGESPSMHDGIILNRVTLNSQPLREDGEIGRWFFDRPPPIPAGDLDAHEYFPTELGLREPLFGTPTTRVLGDCITTVSMVLDMFEPVLDQRGDPAPLRYWDGPPLWSP